MKRADSTNDQPVLVNPFELILQRLERIETLLTATAANDGFTTKAPPPGMSRRRFNELCRELHEKGDKRVRKFGRVWSADPDAVETVRAHRATTEASTRWSPEAALAAAGIRARRS